MITWSSVSNEWSFTQELLPMSAIHSTSASLVPHLQIGNNATACAAVRTKEKQAYKVFCTVLDMWQVLSKCELHAISNINDLLREAAKKWHCWPMGRLCGSRSSVTSAETAAFHPLWNESVKGTTISFGSEILLLGCEEAANSLFEPMVYTTSRLTLSLFSLWGELGGSAQWLTL